MTEQCKQIIEGDLSLVIPPSLVPSLARESAFSLPRIAQCEQTQAMMMVYEPLDEALKT